MIIALLIGSCREGRQSHKIAYYLETELQQRAVSTDIIDLGGNTCRAPGNTAHSCAGMCGRACNISARVQEADALILVTPEYHGSFSGVLKTTLDSMGTEFYRKPIGVVTVSSGRMGGILASAQLQHVVLSLGAYALPDILLVPEVQTAFDDSFQLVNERTIKSAKKFLDEYLWFSDAISTKKKFFIP